MSNRQTIPARLFAGTRRPKGCAFCGEPAVSCDSKKPSPLQQAVLDFIAGIVDLGD